MQVIIWAILKTLHTFTVADILNSLILHAKFGGNLTSYINPGRAKLKQQQGPLKQIKSDSTKI